ncbi:DUF6249 domain-containing protein [Pontimicrobium sp. IMCC45349]|uniref:DUF6249 domain-containing protein n=1 Tax=Pontimicrobium sp. IMCC45349 TaxID=3391574 RepID=UPI00399FD817
MGSEVIIVPIIFGLVFGVFYLHYSTRNKERLALIEKGADASIFNIGKKTGTSWKIIIINLAFLIMGIGVGTLIGSIIDEYTRLHDGAIAGVIFLMAGLGLYIGYTQTKKALD